MADPLQRFDAAVGNGVDRAVAGHHRRRLRKVGWERALAPDGPSLWASGDPPPRAGNLLEVLVDGAVALPRLQDDLERAESSVLFAGWHFTPSFRLRPDGPTLRELLAELAERIDARVIARAGAPLPLFRPSRSDARTMRDTLTKGTRIRMALDRRERPMHCHHEKAVVIDGRVAYVGGIDLTTLAGNRWDTQHLWKPLSEEQLARRQRGEPLTHRLARLPHVSRRSRRLLGPVQSLLVHG
jgi:phosphatidylserine/phosphatidylglycerophosphate/cardiolipin synthase-like enzyme